MEVFIIILFFLLLIFQVEFLNKILKFVIYSPVYLYIIFSITTIVISILYYYYYPIDKKISLYNLDYVTSLEFLNIIKFYLIGINCFLFGVLIFHWLSKRKTRNLYAHKFKSSIPIKLGSKETMKKTALVLFIIVIILFMIGYGTGIFYRERYMPENQIKPIIMMIKFLSLILTFILGIMQKSSPLLTKLYFAVLMLLAIGIGSRIGFIFLMLFIVLSHNSKTKNLKNNFFFIIKIVLAFFFFAYLIQLRMQPKHGIIPYIGYVFDSFSDILEYFMFNLYYVIIFGVFVSIETVGDAVVNWESISISLNPLPGSLVGWYDYFGQLRVNIYCPYSSNGEVFSMGVFFTVLFYTLIGMLFGFFEYHFRRLLLSKQKLPAFILLIILVLHIVYGFEYNLRSTVRYIYYALFIIFFFQFLALFKKRDIKSLKN